MLTASEVSDEVLVDKLSQLFIVEALVVLTIPDPILPSLFLSLKLL